MKKVRLIYLKVLTLMWCKLVEKLHTWKQISWLDIVCTWRYTCSLHSEYGPLFPPPFFQPPHTHTHTLQTVRLFSPKLLNSQKYRVDGGLEQVTGWVTTKSASQPARNNGNVVQRSCCTQRSSSTHRHLRNQWCQSIKLTYMYFTVHNRRYNKLCYVSMFCDI